MGDALVNQLVENGMVKNIADIYDLTEEKLVRPGAHGYELHIHSSS